MRDRLTQHHPRHRAGFRGRRDGFTIIEALVAGMLMALFGAAIAATITQSTAAMQRAEDRRLAAQWLDTVMTKIDIIGPARLALEGPVAGDLDERFSWSAQFEVDSIHLDLYTVNVTVTYRTAGGYRSVKGHTLIQDPPGLRTTTMYWEDL